MEVESLEYREEVMHYVREGFGEVLSCLHDIRGEEEYCRLCEGFRTAKVMDEEEYKAAYEGKGEEEEEMSEYAG